MKKIKRTNINLLLAISIFGPSQGLCDHSICNAQSGMPVDLKVLSSQKYDGTDRKEITIGDLHGNVMKLVYFLISEGILKLSPDENKQKELYEDLYSIYESGHAFSEVSMSTISKPSSQQLKRFKEIINKSEISVQGMPVVRLIGDDLADRGGSDYLTLLVIDKVNKSDKVNFKIIFSNHTAWATQVYDLMLLSEDYNSFKESFKANKKLDFISSNTGEKGVLCSGDFKHQVSSMHGLFYLLEQEKISFTEVKDLYGNYKKHLILIDYGWVSSPNAAKSLVVYTHAPVDLSDVKKVVNHYKIVLEREVQLLNAESMAKLIDLINSKFKANLNFSSDKLNKDLMKGSPVDDLIWKRRKDHGPYILPANINFIHGHDGDVKSTTKGFTNLDSSIGKFNVTKGELPICIVENE